MPPGIKPLPKVDLGDKANNGYKPIPKPKPKPKYVDLADQDKFRTTGLNRGYGADDSLGPVAQDPLNGANLWDLLLGGGYGAGSGSGGSGGGGSGGSAAATDPDPQGWAAIAAAQARQPLYQQQIQAITDKQAADDAAYGKRTSQLGDLRSQGDARTQAILGELQAALGQTQGNVAGVYNQGDQQLAGLQSEYGAMAQARNQGAGRTLGAFGVDPNAGRVSGDPLMDMLVASRATNRQLGTNASQSLASRNQVYAGLGADSKMQSGATYDSLSARIAAEQAKSTAQANSDRANMILQQQAAELAAQQAEQARQAQYR